MLETLQQMDVPIQKDGMKSEKKKQAQKVSLILLLYIFDVVDDSHPYVSSAIATILKTWFLVFLGIFFYLRISRHFFW